MTRTLTMVAALALAGCGVSEELYNARVAELNKVKSDLDAERKATADDRAKFQQQLSDMEKSNQTLKQRLEALGQNVKELEASGTATKSELEEAHRRMEELQKIKERAEQQAAQFKQLTDKLQAMVSAGKLKVERRNGLLLVKLADNILFDPGKTNLKKDGKEALVEVSQVLAGIEKRKFQVAGHTDNQPIHGSKYKTNWELSTARAVEVVHFMIDQGKMPADRLSAAGFADQLPVSPNDTEDGRRANRRIEIVLVPNIDELPGAEAIK